MRNPGEHYWIIAGSTTQVYSSKVGNYVPINDPAYVSWLTIPQNAADKWMGSESELGRFLAKYEDDVGRPVPPAILDGFKEQKSDFAENIFRVLLAPNKLNFENRIRALERQFGGTAPNLSAAELKQLLKDMG